MKDGPNPKLMKNRGYHGIGNYFEIFSKYKGTKAEVKRRVDNYDRVLTPEQKEKYDSTT